MIHQRQSRPLRTAEVDTSRVMARFEQRHLTADNPRRDEFPDAEAAGGELAVVLFARRHRRALPLLAQRAEAFDRLVLIQQMRRLLDREELMALQDGSEAGATWRQLGDPLGITTKNGTVQRMQRLRVAVELGPSALRSPHVLRAHEKGEAEEENSRSGWVQLHHAQVRRASAELLLRREALTMGGEAIEWLDDLADLLVEPISPTCEASIITHLRFAVEEIDGACDREGEEPARTPEAAVALKAARDLVGGYRRRSAP